jgi:DNA polymerase I-like protein with 3'-5' exonuclease and polymerase domains
MTPITIDFETYYDKEYSLSKMSMEAYIRDPRFEVIMLGIRMPDGTKGVITGTHAEIKYKLDTIPWHEHAVLAHNTLFDAAILSWVFDIRPALWLDTLSMANAIHHGKANSLAALAERYHLKEKGTYVHNMLGRRRESLSRAEFKQYAGYCIDDLDICHSLFELMSQGYYSTEELDFRDKFPRREFELIDMIIHMFTEPVLQLDKARLERHLEGVQKRKEELLEAAGIAKEDLMSNPKFAEVLQRFGVVPPKKISATTGKTTFAFAKTDPGMKALLEHPDERVQAIVSARMGVKSTLEETRTQRFIDIAARGKSFPVPLKYYAARTGRLGGTDGINLQNLPARSGKELKAAMGFPEGYVGIDCDSSNIEARVLAWLAEQNDLVEDFANGVDVYCKLASAIYNRTITKDDKAERFVGKTTTLGCGYQTGALKLQATLAADARSPVQLPIEECKRIVDTYRSVNYKIAELWKTADRAIQAMYHDEGMWLGKEGVVWVDGKRGIKLPNGLYIQYPQLHQTVDKETGRTKWVYKDRNGLTDIYGGKLVENVTQALARIIVTYQLLKISKKYKVALTVHDSGLIVVPRRDSVEARAFVEECMRWKPKWAVGCPINCESEVGLNYGETHAEWQG